MLSTSYLPQARLAGSRFLQSWVEVRGWIGYCLWPHVLWLQLINKAIVHQSKAEQMQAQARYEGEGVLNMCTASSQNQHTSVRTQSEKPFSPPLRQERLLHSRPHAPPAQEKQNQLEFLYFPFNFSEGYTPHIPWAVKRIQCVYKPNKSLCLSKHKYEVK